LWVFFALAAGLLTGATAGAESAVLLPYPAPDDFGVIPASTYDEQGRRVGEAAVLVEQLPNENVAVRLHGGFDGGARVEFDAELTPVMVDGRRMLRTLKERSQAHDPDGKPLVTLEIDHQTGHGRCVPPGAGSGRTSEIELPAPDRVVNVPLNLLFQPIGKGQTDSVDTQAFFCLGGARVMGFTGEVVDRDREKTVDGRIIREIKYGPDGRGLLSWAAQPLAPKISFWVDAARDGAYVAHRMPLYSRGPVVYFIADGVDPKLVLPQ
jgi:hypothetical protein